MQDFRIEVDDHGGSTVLVDGYPQSYVSLSDPELLVFELHPAPRRGDRLAARRPGRRDPCRGRRLTLARYVQHTRPGSPQIVLEPDAALTERVRAELPSPVATASGCGPNPAARALPR